eukprot:CAMPEP_0169103092 /NCGR_PEP_ID=MMETSP1015-20121227/22523_1 /TAXON_ID=342587 /ORGANISM="Karlodinium micrum, Strain CCMP2283" /LENGTH=443 /DNA_ID=CAMNT_0009164251 /DNA_START=479 /DNA_END=1810 /DNA_ORIENTATION=-
MSSQGLMFALAGLSLLADGARISVRSQVDSSSRSVTEMGPEGETTTTTTTTVTTTTTTTEEKQVEIIEQAGQVPEGWNGHELDEWDVDDLVGKLIDPWREVQQLHDLGSGAFGTVYGAQIMCAVPKKVSVRPEHNQSTPKERWIALKEVYSKKRLKGLTKVITNAAPREIKIMKALNDVSTYGVQLVDAFQIPNGWMIVMEACEQGDLQSFLKETSIGASSSVGLLNLRQIKAGLFLDAMTGVRDMHVNGLIHRDIKPGNILITNDYRAKLVDFGISCKETALESDVAFCDYVDGTQLFMPPEYFGDLHYKLDKRADMWAMGLILHQLIYGAGTPKSIFQTSSLNETRDAVTQFVMSPPENPTTATRLLQELLNKDPENRLTSEQAWRWASSWVSEEEALYYSEPPGRWQTCPPSSMWKFPQFEPLEVHLRYDMYSRIVFMVV